MLKLYDLVVDAAGTDIAPIMAPGRPGEQLRSCLDASAARASLGWEAWTPIEEGIAQTVEWFRFQED